MESISSPCFSPITDSECSGTQTLTTDESIEPLLSDTSSHSNTVSMLNSMPFSIAVVLQEASMEHTNITTYKLVGDNIDKFVTLRDMRSNHQTQSLHYFHVYGVRDRVDLANESDRPALPDPSSIDVEVLLPSPEDDEAMLTNFSMLVTRVLRKHMKFFQKYGKGVDRHIVHKYQKNMSEKSEVVSLNHTIYSNIIITACAKFKYLLVHTYIHTCEAYMKCEVTIQ